MKIALQKDTPLVTEELLGRVSEQVRGIETVVNPAGGGDAAAAEEALQAYNRIIQDGRYVMDFARDPKAGANRLGINLSDEAATVVTNVLQVTQVDPQTGIITTIIFGIIAGKIMFSGGGVPDLTVVVDESGSVKV